MSLSIVAAIQVINWFIESHKSRCLWTKELRIVVYVTYAESFAEKKMQNAVNHFSFLRWFFFRLKVKGCVLIMYIISYIRLLLPNKNCSIYSQTNNCNDFLCVKQFIRALSKCWNVLFESSIGVFYILLYVSQILHEYSL